MRLDNSPRSSNIEDRRGRGRGPGIAMGGGLGTLILVLVLFFLGVDPIALLQGGGGGGGGLPLPTPSNPFDAGGAGEAGVQTTGDPQADAQAEFVARVLGETEDVWTRIFAQQGQRYQAPTLVLFAGQVQSACGFASSATGPFYCPADAKVYLDTSFFDELAQRFGAPGDFAQAYVIAHEVGHHVQNLLGITDRVHRLRGRVSETEYNDQSVRLELQADFFAGVWAHHSQRLRNILESGDIEEGLRAASAIGDDRIQKQTQGYVVPDSFTHGSSAQRMRWFKLGLQSGDLSQGDTFRVAEP